MPNPNVAIVFKAIVDAIVQFVPRLAGLLIALIIAKMLSNAAERLTLAACRRSKVDEALAKFLGNMARYGVMAVCVVSALGYVGIKTASFAAVLASAGLAVGLAFQGTLSNFAAGVMLVVFRPFTVGDVVTVGGETGKVASIEMFTVELTTVDNRRIIVPNSQVFGSKITNITHHPTRRVDIDVGTDYSANVAETRKVLEQVPGRVQGALSEPAPQIFLANLGGSSVDWQVRIWCNSEDYWDVYQRTIEETKSVLDAAEIGIPFPQMDVHLDGGLDK